MEITVEERASLATPASETILDFCSKSFHARLQRGDGQNYNRIVEQLAVLAG
jgi:hypothetical protein